MDRLGFWDRTSSDKQRLREITRPLLFECLKKWVFGLPELSRRIYIFFFTALVFANFFPQNFAININAHFYARENFFGIFFISTACFCVMRVHGASLRLVEINEILLRSCPGTELQELLDKKCSFTIVGWKCIFYQVYSQKYHLTCIYNTLDVIELAAKNFV